MSFHARRSFTLAFAFALPPKISQPVYDWAQHLKNLPTVKARQLEVLSRDPILHGGVRLEEDRLYILSNDGTQIEERRLPGGSIVASRAATVEARQKIFSRAADLGEFKLEQTKLSFQDFWSIDLGYEVLGAERFRGKGPLLAFAAYPPRLFYLGENLRQAFQITWSEESEPFRYWLCDRVTPVLAENLKNGLTRLVFFRGDRPANYTILDLSGDKRLSDASAVVSKNCHDFYFAGSFGLVHVKY